MDGQKMNKLLLDEELHLHRCLDQAMFQVAVVNNAILAAKAALGMYGLSEESKKDVTDIVDRADELRAATEALVYFISQVVRIGEVYKAEPKVETNERKDEGLPI